MTLKLRPRGEIKSSQAKQEGESGQRKQQAESPRVPGRDRHRKPKAVFGQVEAARHGRGSRSEVWGIRNRPITKGPLSYLRNLDFILRAIKGHEKGLRRKLM